MTIEQLATEMGVTTKDAASASGVVGMKTFLCLHRPSEPPPLKRR